MPTQHLKSPNLDFRVRERERNVVEVGSESWRAHENSKFLKLQTRTLIGVQGKYHFPLSLF